MNDVRIDSHKPLPKSKAATEEKRRIDKIFSEYAHEYARLYVARPQGYVIVSQGQIAPVLNSRQQTSMSLRRMIDLTRNMKQRQTA